MEPGCFNKFFAFSGLFLLISLCGTGSAFGGGPLRLTMTDGTVVEVPCYWIAENQIKFDIAGGEAGVSRSQVVSIQEIVETREFDPQLIREKASDPESTDQRQLLQELTAKKNAISKNGVAASGDAAKKSPATDGGAANGEPQRRIYGPKYRVEMNLPALSSEAGESVLVLQDIVSSNTDQKSRGFNLILYDGDGNVVVRKNCEVYPLSLDSDTQKKLQLKGRLYVIRVGVKPDPKIKRYEIIAVER